MYKKGDLSLSINAIVILILAITMLGLGLAFMRGTFGKVTAQFGEVSGEVQKDMINRLKTSGDNLVLSAYEAEIPQGNTKELYLAIRNDLDSKATFYIDRAKESASTCAEGVDTTNCCITMSAGSQCADITLSTFPRITLESGQTEVMKVKISVHPRAARDSYSLPVHVEAPEASPPYDKTVRLLVIVK